MATHLIREFARSVAIIGVFALLLTRPLENIKKYYLIFLQLASFVGSPQIKPSIHYWQNE